MHFMRKTIFALLTAAMVLTLVAANGGKDVSTAIDSPANMNPPGTLPIVKETVQLNAVAKARYVNGDFDTMPFNVMMEERTNVDIVWEAIPEAQYQEKKNLLLASGDLPDIFFGPFALDVNDLITYGPQGFFIDMTDLIDQYAPNIKREMASYEIMKKAAKAPDGNIYSIPRPNVVGVVEGRDNLFIYKPWIDKVGMDIPETIDEFYALLKAFKEQDPNGNGKNDEIPFTNIFQDYNKHIGGLFGAFGLPFNTYHFVIMDNELIYAPLREEFKDGIAYFHKFYEEELFDKESFTQDKKQYAAKGRQSEQVVGATITWNNFDLPGGNNETASDWITVGPLAGPAGVKLWDEFNLNNGGVSFTGFTITNVNEMPEISMRWCDEFYDKKIGAQGAQGPIGICLEELPDGSLGYLPDPAGMSHTEFRFGNTPGDTPYALWTEDWGKILPRPVHSQKKFIDIKEYYADYMVPGFPGVMWLPEENKFLQSTGKDIQDYVKEQMAQWLLNGGVDEEYDEFVATLKKMGVDEYIKMHEEALNRFNS